MNKPKVYKFNKEQIKLIVESQKSSPQLQTEILDNLADGFGKLLTFGFKQSVSAFKYLTGVGVNVFYGDRYTPTGKFPVKKQNPLAPLSLYNSELAGLPQNYEKLFKSMYAGIKSTDNNQTNEPSNPDTETDNRSTSDLDSVITNLKFDDVDAITYPIKFQFQNLKREAKENSTLMMTTWSLIFKVVSSGNVTESNTMQWTLVGFSSQGPSISRFLDMATSKGGDKEGSNLLKAMSQYAGAPSNELSLIFSNQGQAQKFANAMKKQINDHMKVMIGQVNAKMGLKNTIKTPQIIINVSPILIGDTNIQPQNNNKKTIIDVENDIREIQRQIELYKDQEQYKTYVDQLNSILIKLGLKRKEMQNK